jgi:lipopolysaccharide heptosyltransferase II
VDRVFSELQLTDWRERWLVGLADVGLAVARPFLSRRAGTGARRGRRSILLLRLERVGDLLMTLDAIAAVRAEAPEATVDLVVGSWNESIARLIPGVDRIETLDAPWLAREAGGESLAGMARRAWGWRRRGYELAINFEGDVRSNTLLGLSGAARRVGFDMAGGGPMLTERVAFDPSIHTRSSSLRLVERAFGLAAGSRERHGPGPGSARLVVPAGARARADALLEPLAADTPLVVVHAGGGREIKQWHLDRFAEVANRLSASHGATIVLSGSGDDRSLVEAVKAGLRTDVACLDLVGRVDLVTLGAVLERASLLITGDTGPMHLAAALDVPLVAVFGPSDPARWGPCSERARVVRVQLPCSPCNRIRRPPARCRGHVPDCLAAITADAVYDAAVGSGLDPRRTARPVTDSPCQALRNVESHDLPPGA